jgi:Na+/H+ antiporter NhaD/arsenite permease-like protein
MSCASLPIRRRGIPVWMPAGAGPVVLIAAFAIRQRAGLRFGLLPWRLAPFAAGLFLVIEAAHSLGLATLLARAEGPSESPLALLRRSISRMLGANAIDNLPAYLALEPVASVSVDTSPVRLAALLIGVNAGPLAAP